MNLRLIFFSCMFISILFASLLSFFWLSRTNAPIHKTIDSKRKKRENQKQKSNKISIKNDKKKKLNCEIVWILFYTTQCERCVLLCLTRKKIYFTSLHTPRKKIIHSIDISIVSCVVGYEGSVHWIMTCVSLNISTMHSQLHRT